MNKYITETPIFYRFILKPLCPHSWNKMPEGDEISIHINYIEVNANSIKIGNESETYIITRDLKIFFDFDEDVPIGLEVYSEKSNFEEFDIFDVVITNIESFDTFLNYLVDNMIPVNNYINMERDRQNDIQNTKISAQSRITAAHIIGDNIHNHALITSGIGKHM